MIHQAKQKGRIMKRRMIAVLLSGPAVLRQLDAEKKDQTAKSTAASSSQELPGRQEESPGDKETE